MKFKKGDKVRVKTDLEVYGTYNGGCVFVPEMVKFQDGTYVISRIVCGGNNARYVLKGVLFWCWSDDMLEPVSELSDFIKKVGKYEV